MYVPRINRFEDIPAIEDFIQKNSFATLISVHQGKPWGTHLPMELETNTLGEKVLWRHISKANPQWKEIESQEVLAIFQGPHSYISSSWYDHLNVPTWNYIVVHIYGKIRLMSEPEVHEALKRLVKRYEAISEKPVSVETMPAEYVKKEMKGIVGFEMIIY